MRSCQSSRPVERSFPAAEEPVPGRRRGWGQTSRNCRELLSLCGSFPSSSLSFFLSLLLSLSFSLFFSLFLSRSSPLMFVSLQRHRDPGQLENEVITFQRFKHLMILISLVALYLNSWWRSFLVTGDQRCLRRSICHLCWLRYSSSNLTSPHSHPPHSHTMQQHKVSFHPRKIFREVKYPMPKYHRVRNTVKLLNKVYTPCRH